MGEKWDKGLLGWIDARFPLSKMWYEHLAEYYAPKNFNFWYYFGSLALLMIIGGILLLKVREEQATVAGS